MRRNSLLTIGLGIGLPLCSTSVQAQSRLSTESRSPQSAAGVAKAAALESTAWESITKQPAVVRGDANGDGAVNNFDIEAFGMAIADPQRYASMYPGVNAYNLDIDGDGRLTNFDIDPFVALLVPTQAATPTVTQRPGDANCDGAVNNFDIDVFVMALIEPEKYAVLFGGCDVATWEPDGDGRLTNLDIDPMAALILRGGS